MKGLQSKHVVARVGIALMLSVMLTGSTFAQGKTKTEPGRTAYQARVIVQPLGTGFQTTFMEIPAGKRFVIENVSVITRSPEGMRMEVNYFTYIDRNDDGIGDIADITFHRVVLVDQGTFDGVSLATANHKVLVFADEQIGIYHYKVAAQARLNGAPPAGSFPQAQFTFSGYLEDLPTAQ